MSTEAASLYGVQGHVLPRLQVVPHFSSGILLLLVYVTHENVLLFQLLKVPFPAIIESSAYLYSCILLFSLSCFIGLCLKNYHGIH